MGMSKMTKVSEKHAEEILSKMLAEGEDMLCTVNCAFKSSNMTPTLFSTIPLMCYAACTSGGKLLLAVFEADIFDEYSAKAFDISILKNLKINKKLFGEYRIKAEFPVGNRSREFEISIPSTASNGDFHNQAANLGKMLEILRKYET